MKYKSSKFNYIHKCDNGEILLYNSLVGTKSLIKVRKNNAEKVLNAIKGTNEVLDDDLRLLIETGYIIPIEKNEDEVKKIRVMEQVMDSTLHLIILPTEQCNFRCKYCYEGFNKGKMSADIQESLIKYVRNNIHKYTGLNVSWFGGEPLEALDIVEYLSTEFQKICKTAKKVYSAGMTTNGYNLSLDVYKKLHKLGVYNYQITIDGLKENHDMQRVLSNGQGSFDRIVSNLSKIKQSTNYFNSSFIIRTNFSKGILNNLESFLSFYINTFNNDSRFNLYIHMASDWGGERVGDFCGEMLSYGQYHEILNRIKKYGVRLNHDSHLSHLNYRGCVCYASRKNSVVIGSDGTLYKCTGDFEFDKNKVGILEKDGTLNYNDNLNLWLGGIHALDKKCDSCYYSACCLSNSCPAVRVRGLSNDSCSFEKEHMGLFLELFDEKLFYII